MPHARSSVERFVLESARAEREMTRTVTAVGALALLASCTHVGRFEPKHFASWQIAENKKLDGRALVLTTVQDDAYVWSGRPTGAVGAATTLTLPLGVLVREAAKRVFGDLFLGGADASNDTAHLDGYRAVVSPRITAFSYRYGWSAIFMTESGEFALSMRVALLDARGGVTFERTYASGRLEVAGRSQVAPAEAISQAAHVAAQALMLQAAADIATHLATQAASASRLPGAAANEVRGRVANP
jgi:hypothetical protein